MNDIVEKDEKKEKSGFSINPKKLVGAIAAATGIGLGVYAATEVYDHVIFKRYDRPDYSVTPGLYNYELVRPQLPREEISFYSDNTRLQGYYYQVENPKALVVVSHGMHAGADDYLPIVLFFTQNGYSVFSYDYKGTYNSDGDSTVGMCESVVDLDYALRFIKTDSRFKGLKICLIGHSWGGFASASVLSIQNGISACACLAPFNNGYKLFLEKGRQYAGEIGDQGIPKYFLDIYQKSKFKDYADATGVKGINSVNIPVLIAHGNNDKIISYTEQSIICHHEEITNPNVEYYIGKGLQAGHDSIWHSEESAIYMEQVKNDLKRLEDRKGDDLTHEELAAYNKTVDHELYSEINKELFQKILQMFDKAVKIL